MAIELVIFDLGRVLIRICEDWQHSCQIAGVTVPANLAPMTESEKQAVERIVERYDTGKMDGRQFAREIGPFRNLSEDEAFRAHSAYLLGPYPGIDLLLSDLSHAGLKTACLSNTSEHHWQQINDPSNPNFLGLDRLTWRFASHLIGQMKPHDAIYEHVERETKLAPELILFFDDLEANTAAARARGWHAQTIAHDGDPVAQIRRHLRRYELL